jgi:Na+/melibiose symporter-like transporter
LQERIKGKKGKLLNYLLIGSGGEGVVMVVIAFSLFFSDWIMVLIITLILLAKGLFSETMNIPYLVWYQKLVPKKIRAKLNNVKDIILTLPMLLSYPLVGYLLDKFPNWLIIFIFGFLAIVASLIGYSVLRKIFKKDAISSTI